MIRLPAPTPPTTAEQIDRLIKMVTDLQRRVAALEAGGEASSEQPKSSMVGCMQCFGTGRIPGAAIGGFVSCPSCHGSGVHRV